MRNAIFQSRNNLFQCYITNLFLHSANKASYFCRYLIGMEILFPKSIADKMKACLLSIFWPKKEIIAFFKNNGCTSSDLNGVTEDLHRSTIIDTLFEQLYSRTDGGLGQFRAMLKSLIEWDHFDVYYFFTIKKLDLATAKLNIQNLKKLQEERDEKIDSERKQTQQKKDAEGKKHLNYDFKTIFLNLFQGKDANGKTINSQQRGYLLEDFLKNLFVKEGISTSENFALNIVGEQIDGVFKFEGENYIVEAKWHDDITSTNALYVFSQKVEGKMYGRGFFISINGFTSGSVIALKTGKALRTVLVDGGDLPLVIEGMCSLTELIDRKIEAAQTRGHIYVDSHTMKEKISS